MRLWGKSLLRFLVFVWICVLYSGIVLAQADTTASKKSPTTTKAASPATSQATVLLYIQASDELEEMACGLNLILLDRLAEHPFLDPVSPSKIMQVKSKGQPSTGRTRIHRQDIPFLALSTEAVHVVLGELESDGPEFVLTLRSYNALSGDNERVEKIRGKAGELARFDREGTKILGSMFGQSQVDIKYPLSQRLGLDRASELGQSWKQIQADSLPTVLSRLLALKQQGLTLPALYKTFLIKRLEEIKKKPLNKLSMALKAICADLTEDTAQAFKLYKKVKYLGSLNRTAKIRYARLLYERKQWDAMRKTLTRLEKDDPRNPDIHELWGDLYAATSAESLRDRSWAKAAKLKSQNAEFIETFAMAQVEQRKIVDAAMLFNQAARLYEQRHNRLKASELYLQAVRYGAGSALLNHIDIPSLSEQQQKELKQLLPTLSNAQPASRNYILARLAEQGKDPAKTLDYYDHALIADPHNVEIMLAMADLLVKEQINPQRAIELYQSVLLQEPENLRALAQSAWLLKVLEDCPGALQRFNRAIEIAPKEISLLFQLSDLQMACRKSQKAEDSLEKVLAIAPDNGKAMVALIKMYLSQERKRDWQKMLALLWKTDVALAKEVEASLPVDEQEEEERRKRLQEEQRKKNILIYSSLNFPEVSTLISELPTKTQKVLLFDYQTYYDRENQGWLSWIFSPFHIDPKPVFQDLRSLFGDQVWVVDDIDAMSMLQANCGNPLDRECLQAMAKSDKYDGIVGMAVKQSETVGIKYELDLTIYYTAPNRLMHHSLSLTSRKVHLVAFNLLLPVIILFTIGFIIGLYFLMKHIGAGSVTVKIKYDRTFEEGYFAVRVSRRNLTQAFAVEKLLNRKWRDSDEEDAEEAITQFFKTLNPFVAIAHNNIARLERVPPGKYNLYITGIMINISTRLPIGTHEVQREIVVKKKEENRIVVDFVVNETYVEIRATRLLAMADQIVGKMGDGSEESAAPKRMVTVSINNEPALTETVPLGDPVSHYLPKGTYRIAATMDEFTASEEIVIEDTLPQIINLELHRPHKKKEKAPSGEKTAPTPKLVESDGEERPQPVEPADAVPSSSASESRRQPQAAGAAQSPGGAQRKSALRAKLDEMRARKMASTQSAGSSAPQAAGSQQSTPVRRNLKEELLNFAKKGQQSKQYGHSYTPPGTKEEEE